MGIDAKMLVRGVARTTATPEWIKLMSARLAREVGENHFFQDRKNGRGALHLTNHYEGDDEIFDGSVYHQDGPEIHARLGEALLEVSLWTRYYGVGYERGDLIAICAVAEWLEYNIPECTVWYGGDSSGVSAQPFGREKREELKKHLYSVHGQNYFMDSKWGMSEKLDLPIKDCQLCAPKYYRLQQFGYGGNYAAYHCAVCGFYCATRDHGQTWITAESQEELVKAGG